MRITRLPSRCGDPLIEGNDDGLFYDPVEDADASADFDDENCLFVGDLAVGDLDGDNNYEVVGNLAPYGIYVIEYDHSPTPTVTKEWFREAEDAWHCAPSLADLDSSGTSEVILSGGDKPRLYVWECDGRTFQRTIDSLGVYGSVASGAKYNFGHVAVGEFDPRSDGLEIIQSLGDVDSGGNCAPSVTCWSTADSTGSQLWTTAIGGAYYLTLSTPVIGDIDASDEALEIVVSRQAHDDAVYQKGGLWMLNDAGGIVQYVEHDDLFLRVEPPPVPALAELGDGDDALEVFLADGREGDNDGDWSALLPLYLWEPDSSAAVDTTTVSDRLPIPGRKHQHSIGQYQPVIADLDGDDSLEVVVSNNSGYLGCFGMTSGDTLKAEAGWPQRFGDIPLTPLVADVNADGDLDLVVVDRSGTVHLLKLPGEAAGASLPWPQFGHDAGNTSNYHGLSRGRGSTATGDEPGLVADRLLMVGPTLLQEQVGIRFSLPRAEEVDLRVLDLQGRVVCTLLSGLQPAGEHTVHWDGRSQSGVRLTDGVYFIRLVRPDRMDTRRVAVIH